MKTMQSYLRAHSLQLFVAVLICAGLAFGMIDPATALVGGIMLDTVPTDLKALAEATQKALAKISDEVREAGQTALAEAKKHGDMYAADKPKVDEMLVKQGELQARLHELEQKADRRGGNEAQTPETIGHALIKSDEYKAWLQSGGMRSAQSGFVFKVNAAITELGQPTTNTTTVGVGPDVRPGVVLLPERRLVVRDLIAPGRTNSNAIQYVKETGFTNNAATVSETVQKPESTIVYALVQGAVVTIAHFVKASKQIMDDMPQLQSMIDNRMRYGLSLVEETQLLKGSGSGNNLNGIYTQATAYSAPITIGAPSKIDILRLMCLQVELALFPCDGFVVHPSDWAAIELKKDTLGRYIIGVPQGIANPTLWGRPVVATQAMTVDTALCGAFKMGAQVFDREDSNVVISTENQDDFIKNMVTIRNEERLALAVYRPEAFIKNADLVGS